ncbi:flavodoxin family protein [Mycetocola sp.]|jgi:multimeric flavodoxin WrbA|uniref:flavodoxin family protein n=1 Tax=Mycetocola sp. TaxID=1871042 RepID=UPI00260EC3CF|nr:NAD(P)H-dependent oxidoreductase [Mycetocola sp.]MCU1560141.1 Multimeric flavodoxin WrbA [Mycetocola sp.]
MESSNLSAVALICTLTPSPGESSSDLLADQFLEALRSHGVDGSKIRVVDHDVRPGVQTDMGDGDAWPSIREKVLAADILLVSTPTWAGHMSSVASRVVERLDAELSETDADGRPILYDKVALVAVVGNEDGAHKVSADLFQALNDYGYTIPAQGVSYWNGEAMHTTDYKDLDSTPEVTASALSAAVSNAVHLARLLKAGRYPKTD